MKIFLDANVIIAVLNKEYPLFSYAARILSLTESTKFSLFTSPLCLAIAFYFAEKKSGSKTANKKLALLASKINITTINPSCIQRTLSNPRITDFEDGMEYYSALDSGCQMLITEDTDDFYFAEIQVMNSESFFKQYLVK